MAKELIKIEEEMSVNDKMINTLNFVAFLNFSASFMAAQRRRESVESVLKIPLNLDQESAQILDGQSRILNWAYNRLLEISLEARNKFIETGDKEQGRIAYSKRGLRNLLPDMKKEHQFLKSVHSSPLKNAALRLSKSIEDYQGSRKGRRKGKKTGWPKYRSWSQKFFSLLYDEPKKGFKVDDRELTLSLGTNAEGKRLRITGMLEKSPFSFKDTEIRNLCGKRES